MLVYVCTAGQEAVTTANRGLGQTGPLPTCADGGAWMETADMVKQGLEFSLSQLDPAILGAAFGSGFIIVATAFVIGRPVAALLHMIGK